jgi:hypothetical protein
MSADKLSLEIAALEKQSGKAKNAVIKKVLLKKIDKLKVELEAITSAPVAKAKIQRAKTKISQMTPKEFADYIKKLSKDPKYSFLKGMSSDEIARDVKRTAKPVGWRFRGRENFKTPTKRDVKDNNNVYYENRRNRSDVSRSLRLEEGGELASKGMRIGTNFSGNKLKESWGKHNLHDMYSNVLHLAADLHDYFKQIESESGKSYSDEMKSDLIEILKNGALKGRFGSENLKFEEGGEITANERMQSLKNYPKLKF